MLATYHNHSDWSDGRSSVGEVYEFAKRAGIDVLGLSDHFCVYPNGSSPDWSVQPSETGAYLAEIRSLGRKGKVEVRVGLEFDWFESHAQVVRPFVEGVILDYRIGAIHHVQGQQFDVNASYWTDRSEEERNDVWVKYWQLVQGMAESRLFDIAAHLDLPKKLGFNPTSDVSPYLNGALDAILAADMVVELNTAGFGKPCADAYPSLYILQKCAKRGIPVTLSSDAHIPEHVCFEFERGAARLHEAGFSSVARFRDRERFFEPLADALKRR